MKVYCGLCGFGAQELFSHLRGVHSMGPERYRERCPGAPLISEELGKYIRENNVQITEGTPRKEVTLFGLTLMADVVPGKMVPPYEENYVLRSEIGKLVTASVKEGENCLLVGPTGSGKSTLVEQIATRLNWPVVRVAASGGLTEADLLGEWTVQDGETRFNYGFLPRAMRDGAICLVDEVDGLEPSVAFALHQVLEENGRLVLLQNGAEIIEPHPRFRLVCTANTLGHGDDTGLYTGTRVLNAAFLDRFNSIVTVGYVDEKDEIEILQRLVTDCRKHLIKKLVRAGNAVREARENDQVFCTLSTRRLIDIARKTVQLGSLYQALEVALLSRLAPEDRGVVEEIFQRHIGDVLEKEGSANAQK